MERIRLVAIVAVVLAIALSLAIVVGSLLQVGLVLLHISATPRAAFDSAVWKDGARTLQGDRFDMADWLIKKRALDNKTRVEVVAMLDEPPRMDYFKDWDLVYWLGREREAFIGIDSEWLVVRFDTKGRVRDYKIIRD
jgi:hypothetical protein